MAIDYKPEQNDYTNLTPFKTWLVNQINTWGINNFPFLESDFDKLSNYGMMMKLMKAMNDVIGNQNLVESDMSNLFNAFTELQNYINNYFDNLDVQDEINNKLDEMTESGELLNMIKGYVDPFINEQNSKITHIENKVDAVVTGSPLVASSVSEMTDTTRIYVNTTDGYWYYYNGEEWVQGGIYQATGDSENYIYQTKLTNFGNYETNKYVDYTNGNTYNLNNNYASDYIEVMKESKIIIGNFTTITADSRGLAFYDENKTFISGVQYPSNSSGIEAITPQNAKYLRFTFHVTNETTIVKIIFKNEILISNLLNSSIKINFDVTTKIKEHEYNRAFVSKNNGTLQIYTNTNMKYSDYIPINSDVVLTLILTSTHDDERGLAFYDSSLSFISGQGYTSSLLKVTVPESAKYVRLTLSEVDNIYYLTSNKNFSSLFENNNIINSRPSDSKSKIISTFSNLLAIGDSLTTGTFNHNEGGSTEYVEFEKYSWPTQLNKATGIEVDNMGQGGLSTKRWYETQQGRITGGHDICVINLGANDTQANGMTVALFEQYMQLIINKVKETNPKIKIFLASLLPNYYFANRSWFAPFRRKLIDIANNNTDCYLVDLTLYSDCLANTVYSQGHLTALGYKKESDELIGYISDIMEKNIDDFKWIQFIDTDYEYIED